MSGTLLVTGAQGFVGRWLVHHASAHGSFARIVGIGRSVQRSAFTHRATLGPHAVAAPLPDALREPPAIFSYARCDVRDADALAALLRVERPRAVVHLASALRDDPSDALFQVNVEGTIALLQAIARSGGQPERIVLGSSGSVYGAPRRLPARESDAPAPPDLYAVSKLAAEEAARVLAREHGFALVVARIFNVVGPGLDERHACARFASQLAAIAAGLLPPRVVVGDLSPTRDIVGVRDVAAALTILAERGAPGETYNVASGRETAMQDVLDTLLEISGLVERVEVSHEYHRAADCARVVADVSRAVQLGFVPEALLAPSLHELYAYYAGAVAAAAGSPGVTTCAPSASATAASATHG